MTFDSPVKIESDVNPIVCFERGDLPTRITVDDATYYPFVSEMNLDFSSVNEGQRWIKDLSARERRIGKLGKRAKSFENAVHVSLFLPLLAFGFGLYCFASDAFDLPLSSVIGNTGMALGGFGAMFGIVFLGSYLDVCREQAEGSARRELSFGFPYRMVALDHPMFPKNNPLVQYGATIFALRNKQFGIGEKQGFKERLGVSSTPLDTGESTRRMLEEHEKYLGMAGRFAELWPDADQPTRAAIVKDMEEKAEALRTACANYQADVDQIAKINREKQDYLAQQEAEAETIITEAKAAEAADEYRRVKAQYDF